MNCQQKSGIFLNMSCENEATKQCSNCEKKVCKTHHHILSRKKLCEDCYWEYYLYSTSKQFDNSTDVYSRKYTRTATTTSNSTSSASQKGFDDGFGGGQFGGGGASGAWTEGDKEGFNAADMAAGAGLGDTDNDSTFFYS